MSIFTTEIKKTFQGQILSPVRQKYNTIIIKLLELKLVLFS